MSFTAAARRVALPTFAAAIAATSLLGGAAPANAAATSDCPETATVQPFGPWQDFADYFMAPDGDLEGGGSTWDLQDGAAVVEDDESFGVGAAADHRSLSLPGGSSATTATMCIGAEHRTMRFFVRGSGAGSLRVQAVYDKRTDKEKRVHIGSIAGTTDWAPSDILPMRVNEIAADNENALPVALRFTAHGAGAWQIDDVYVDPYRMG